jgi:hypothetical protein
MMGTAQEREEKLFRIEEFESALPWNEKKG